MKSTAPARVNLIGEHTDYTGGSVLPFAIPFFTEATVESVDDGLYHFESELFPDTKVLQPNDRNGRAKNWSDYPIGVLREMQSLGHRPAPFRLLLKSDVPLGSGLSSSASVEVATAFVLLKHLGVDMEPEQIALLCQRAENQYVGAPCGIMDQTVVVLTQKGHALLLDTRSLTTEAVPMNRGIMRDTSLVVCNSMVKHSIAGGEYGQRRKQVEEGQAAIKAGNLRASDLGRASIADLETVRAHVSLEAYKRCKHIITENARVRSMQHALLEGNAHAAGELLLAAHASQRNDFECSIEEIDFLVETASKLRGCYGARMTGGGFGGCTISLVHTDAVESFRTELARAYAENWNITAEIFVCEAVDGALRRNLLSGAAASVRIL